MGFLLGTLWPIAALVTAWTMYCQVGLWRNYRIARATGLPVRIIPIDHMNPLWMLLDSKIVPLVKRLPFGLGNNNFTRYNWRSWERADGCRSHDEMGDAFMMASPRQIWLYIADPEALMNILRRKNDFDHNPEMSEILAVFGPSIATSTGKSWQKQRRLTAPCFNNQTNSIVWSEAVSLASNMIQYWTSKPQNNTMAHDVRTLSLHVMSKAGFGQSFKFVGHDERVSTDAATSYKDSLQEILENCILIMILGTKFLAKPWLPAKLRKLHTACVSFQRHMTDVYETEKRAAAEGRAQGHSLLTSLIRASQAEATSELSLTERETYGNMFVFNFAGHDTVAHTLVFTLFFLAANPQVQDWMSEELHHVLGERPTREWSYETDTPRLKRCLAVMLETLRLYTPVPVAKLSDDKVQQLEVGGKTVPIPPRTNIIPSYMHLHQNPKYWGADSPTWRPSRWITSKAASADAEKATIGGSGRLDDEEVIKPVPGTFLGWSEGARDCPGRKFSQVEFVGAMAVLFRDWRVEPVAEKGETPEAARSRILKFIETDSAAVLLLQMMHPERAPLAWKRR